VVADGPDGDHSDNDAEGGAIVDGEEDASAGTAVKPAIRLQLGAGAAADNRNGEEDEATQLQLRAKLYVLDKSAGGPPRWRECGIGPLRVNVRNEFASAAAAAVRSSSTSGSAGASGRAAAKAGAAAPAPAPVPAPAPGDSDAAAKARTAVARLIMRQEHHPGGHGTRLLLNVALWPGLAFQRAPQADNAVQLTAFTTEPPRTLTADPMAAAAVAGGARGAGAGVAASSSAARPTPAAPAAVSDAAGAASDAKQEDASRERPPAAPSAGTGGAGGLQLYTFMIKLSKPEQAAQLASVVSALKTLVH
jgi:hypothetical protein